MEAHAAHSMESGVSMSIMALALGGAALTAGIVLAPHLLPVFGIGSAIDTDLSITLLHSPSNLAGELNDILAAVPLVGTKLAEGGFFNAIVTGLLSVGGMWLGDAVGKNGKGENAEWGKFIKYGALATSALVALPTLLTALGSGIIFIASQVSNTAVASEVVGMVDATLGSMGTLNHTASGLSGMAATLPHFAACGAALVPAALGMQLWKKGTEPAYTALDTKGNPLPASDPNHGMTKNEIALMERYNNASPIQKIIVKKEILDQGYDPDFHKDGTVHLFKHSSGHKHGISI